MGRPPSNGGPSFRFNPTEVAEMESILQAHNTQVPPREILVALAEKFSNSSDRCGKVVVQMKQVWNWFQNRRYALRAKAAKVPVKLSASPGPPNDLAAVRHVPQAPQHNSVPPGQGIVRNVSQVLQPISPASVPVASQNGLDNFLMEFEAKSARDGAWYDVANFISHRAVETSDPVTPDANTACGKELIQEVLVRFAGLGPEEDEWVNIRKHVRQRSLPCEATECVTVLPGDLILCFQEGKEQALYFDAHVLDAQRRRHDVRGCRCRFLVRYDHDQSEEIVPLKKVCRRPETDYRMQQLHYESANINRNKVVVEPHMSNTVIYPSSEATTHKLHKAEAPAETKEQPPKAEELANSQPMQATISETNASATTSVVANAVTSATAAAVVSPTNILIAQSSVSAASAMHPAIQFSDSGATASTDAQAITSGTTPAAASITIPITSTVTSANLDIHYSDSVAIVPTVSASGAVAQSITTEATPSVANTTNAVVQLIDSGATVPTAAASTNNPAIQLTDSGAPVPMVAGTATPTTLSVGSGATASPTTQNADSCILESSTSATTTTATVANTSVAEEAIDFVISTTTVPNSNLAGANDSTVPTTTPANTADSYVAGVAEPVSTDTTLIAGSGISEAANSEAVPKV